MTANTELIFNDLAYGRIKGGCTAVATSIELYPGEILSFLKQYSSGKEFYATITNSQGDIEIVLVTDVDAANNKLTATRGQESTSGQAWYDGAIISQRLTAAGLDAIIQKEVFRTVAYNPNGVLTASYPGEKVYQSGDEACEKRWWKNTSGTNWRLIAGDLCEWEEYDENGYVIETWRSYFTNGEYWQGDDIPATWVTGPPAYWSFNSDNGIYTEYGWEDDYRPDQIRITFTGASVFNFYLKDTLSNSIVAEANPTSGTAYDIVFISDDIKSIYIDGNSSAVNITNIEFL